MSWLTCQLLREKILTVSPSSELDTCDRLMQRLCGEVVRVWSVSECGNFSLEVFGEAVFWDFETACEIIKNLHYSPGDTSSLLQSLQAIGLDEAERTEYLKILKGIVTILRNRDVSEILDLPPHRYRTFKEYSSAIDHTRLVHFPVPKEDRDMRSIALANALFRDLVRWTVGKVNSVGNISQQTAVRIVQLPRNEQIMRATSSCLMESLSEKKIEKNFYNEEFTGLIPLLEADARLGMDEFIACNSDFVSVEGGEIKIGKNRHTITNLRKELSILSALCQIHRDTTLCLSESGLALVRCCMKGVAESAEIKSKNRRDRFSLRERLIGGEQMSVSGLLSEEIKRMQALLIAQAATAPETPVGLKAETSAVMLRLKQAEDEIERLQALIASLLKCAAVK